MIKSWRRTLHLQWHSSGFRPISIRFSTELTGAFLSTVGRMSEAHSADPAHDGLRFANPLYVSDNTHPIGSAPRNAVSRPMMTTPHQTRSDGTTNSSRRGAAVSAAHETACRLTAP